ncbi:hypothetical protein RGQ29_001222 [Quercus rubra]|uniref:Cupin type-1 domain-containing protein n=1 Tax=Quercus rubra TaxID=3512 RepID=A0AAN7G5A4_QUERU|nr:hypothetical protein RGQ29_001222 [Quercus rubra]
MMKVVIVAILALATSLVSAYDPNPLQDFCVAINNTNSTVLVNGKFCKDSATVTADNFFFSGLNIFGNTATNKLGSSVNLVNVDKLPGLKTLGISLAHLDFVPYGLNPLHTHPRSTEILVIIEGTFLVGFVTSNPNKLFTKFLNWSHSLPIQHWANQCYCLCWSEQSKSWVDHHSKCCLWI